jgi:colicin import membrane protein
MKERETTMKNTYRVEMMTKEEYGKMMRGEMWYRIDHANIEAETREEAIETAHRLNPDKVINEGYVKTLDELEAEKKLAEERRTKEEEKEEAKKAKRLANEIAKAEAEGLTLEEYKAKKNHERKIKAAEKAVAEAKKALAEAEKRLAELMK